MRLFLLWYQILGENAPCDLHWIFGCLVPGFFITTDKGIVTLETIVSGAARDSYDETSAEGEEGESQ